MKILLIPSRHIIHSREQVDTLLDILKHNKFDKVIFAITSYNLNNCKYSPVDLITRVNFIDALIHDLRKDFEFSFTIVNIPHYRSGDGFVHKVAMHIELATALELDAQNTEVLAFGLGIKDTFEKSGFIVHYSNSVGHLELFKELIQNNNVDYFNKNISASSKYVLDNRPEILKSVANIWQDQILKETGSLTDHRDYNVYTSDMSNAAIIKVKYDDIKNYIIDGKIVDEGCADAMLFAPISKDYPDSDLIGVDISNDFIARANENIRRGIYGNSFVTILQANLLYNNFKNNSVSTFICNSTMHEIWSYNQKHESVNSYLRQKYSQLMPGGRIIIRDVIGPADKDRVVLLSNLEDGGDANFVKFTKDFKHLRDDDKYEEVTINGKTYFKMRMKLLAEYLLHKDYHNNWNSEMCEEFCHFSLDDWNRLALDNDFKIVTIKSYLSEWIQNNRYIGRVQILDPNTLESIKYPDTNTVIVLEK